MIIFHDWIIYFILGLISITAILIGSLLFSFAVILYVIRLFFKKGTDNKGCIGIVGIIALIAIILIIGLTIFYYIGGL